MKKLLPTIVVCILIAVLGTVFYRTYIAKYSYTAEKADLNAYYEVADENDYPVILQDQFSDYHVKKIGESYYLDLGILRELINDRFYYCEEDMTLNYCLPDTRITAKEGSDTWTDSSGKKTKENYAVCVMDGEVLYVALDFARKYSNFSYTAFTEPNRVSLYTEWGEREEAEVTRDTSLRTLGGVKSKVVCDVTEGSRVVVIERLDNWSRVETEDAMIGYIENRKMTEPEKVAMTPVTDVAEPEYKHIALDGKVNLVWHGIAGAAGNATLADRIDKTKSVNAVGPTWFSVLNENGTVESRATKDYVDAVHERGMQVWAVLDNFNGPDGVQQSFLTKDESRSAVIDYVVGIVKEMGIEGINVDIEGITEEYGEDYIEFIRELSIVCRAEEIILSVDNYVPYNFNDYYRLDEQGLFADYVVIMGYDEHYAGSSEAGSVASLDYVTYGIEEALKFVPKERLVNAIPFYSRIWKTTSGGLSSEAYGMREIRQFVESHKMTVEWNGMAGQNYAESADDEATYQIWIEDAESIEKKLEVMESHSIAGVAEWCLGMETEDVWDVIAEYVQK
ncbi:MAG TPA: chitinase [Lachnospiraceae bacterium]|nr:chitinase [Lachnospiraceae bacterium]